MEILGALSSFARFRIENEFALCQQANSIRHNIIDQCVHIRMPPLQLLRVAGVVVSCSASSTVVAIVVLSDPATRVLAATPKKANNINSTVL